MSVGRNCIYSSTWSFQEMTMIFECLAKNSISLFHPVEGDITYLDNQGDTLQVDLNFIERRINNHEEVHFKLWVPSRLQILWSIYRSPQQMWVQDFSFYAIDLEGCLLFLESILPLLLSGDFKSLVGFYTDYYDQTDYYDWDAFFYGRIAEPFLLPDILYLKDRNYDADLSDYPDAKIFETKYGLILTKDELYSALVEKVLQKLIESPIQE